MNLKPLDRLTNRITENYRLASVVALRRNGRTLSITTCDDHAVSAITTLAHREGLSATTFDLAPDARGFHVIVK